MTKTAFDFEGKAYEIRCTTEGGTRVYRAYQANGEPAGYEHHVDSLTSKSLYRKTGFDADADAVESAKDDVCKRFWEKYHAAHDASK